MLAGLPLGHQCGRLHGHNYEIELLLEGFDLDETGFVLDYGALTPFKNLIDTTLDHRHINDVVGFNPTAENLARWLYGEAVALFPGTTIAGVRVYETPKTCAEYRP